jgi:hypothetical protein
MKTEFTGLPGLIAGNFRRRNPAAGLHPAHIPRALRLAGPAKHETSTERIVLGRIGRRAIHARKNVTAKEAMTPRAEHDQAHARLDAMIERMQRQKLSNLPVTTSDGRLVDCPTVRDAEEAGRRLGGCGGAASGRSPSHRSRSSIRTSARFTRRRGG